MRSLELANQDLIRCTFYHDSEKNLHIKSVIDNVSKREDVCFFDY